MKVSGSRILPIVKVYLKLQCAAIPSVLLLCPKFIRQSEELKMALVLMEILLNGMATNALGEGEFNIDQLFNTFTTCPVKEFLIVSLWSWQVGAGFLKEPPLQISAPNPGFPPSGQDVWVEASQDSSHFLPRPDDSLESFTILRDT